MNIDDPERHVTRVRGLSVLFVMATEKKCGPQPRSRIDDLTEYLHVIDAKLAASPDRFSNFVASGEFHLRADAA